jgi:hypothetical protein
VLIARSEDNGESWELVSNDYHADGWVADAVAGTRAIYLVGTVASNVAVWRSTDACRSWELLRPDGYRSIPAYGSAATADGDSIFVVGVRWTEPHTEVVLWDSSDNGESWEGHVVVQSDEVQPIPSSVAAQGDTIVIGGTVRTLDGDEPLPDGAYRDATVWVSDDGGRTWFETTLDAAGFSASVSDVVPIPSGIRAFGTVDEFDRYTGESDKDVVQWSADTDGRWNVHRVSMPGQQTAAALAGDGDRVYLIGSSRADDQDVSELVVWESTEDGLQPAMTLGVEPGGVFTVTCALTAGDRWLIGGWALATDFGADVNWLAIGTP